MKSDGTMFWFELAVCEHGRRRDGGILGSFSLDKTIPFILNLQNHGGFF